MSTGAVGSALSSCIHSNALPTSDTSLGVGPILITGVPLSALRSRRSRHSALANCEPPPVPAATHPSVAPRGLSQVRLWSRSASVPLTSQLSLARNRRASRPARAMLGGCSRRPTRVCRARRRSVRTSRRSWSVVDHPESLPRRCSTDQNQPAATRGATPPCSPTAPSRRAPAALTCRHRRGRRLPRGRPSRCSARGT